MPGMKQQAKEKLTLFLLRHSRFFDEKWYREQAGLPAGTDAAAHYYRGGWREHDPSRSFRQEGYLAANEDVRRADICPLGHWVLYGKRQHYALYPGYAENHYHAYRLPRALLRVFFETVFRRKVKRNRDARLLVIAHIHYPEALDEMLEYLKNLRPYAWDLVVTTTEGENAQKIRDGIRQFREDAEVREYPNRGFDVYPFLDALGSRNLDGYSLVVKVHAKRCDPRGGRLAEGMYFRGRDWFTGLMRGVLGARQVHGNIDRLLRDDTVDLAAAKHLILQDTPRKEKLAARFLKPFGLALETGYTWVAGGCLMMKAACAEQLKQVSCSPADFPPVVNGSFSAASALERYISGVIPAERKLGVPVRVFSRGRSGGTQAGTVPCTDKEETGRQPVAAFAVTETGENAVAGDYYTALELAKALEAKGWRTNFLSRKALGDGWYSVGTDTDVLVSLLEDYDPQHIRDDAPDLVTVGWARNWFDRWAKSPGAGVYDILLASSESACRELETRLGRKTGLFPIAANADRFREEPAGETSPEYTCDICFTGNRFGKREIEDELVPGELPYTLHIYGEGWGAVRAFAPYCRGHVPYEDMPKIYHGAKIALDDATASTRETGSVNSRVFDALAAGCLVLTNNAVGAAETFEGRLPVYRDRESLEKLLKQYLEDGQARQEKVRELRAFVLEKHTYGIRAEQLAEIIRAWRAEEV
ncbi:MAG: glycosyltransferase [Clostridia bacterium]|nr:glycosyltransferase [Clostridia bacterium]